MKYIIFILFYSLLFFSCQHETKIDETLSEDRLTELIVDMHLMEAVILKYERTNRDSIENALKQQLVHMYQLGSIEKMDSLINSMQSDPSYFITIEEKAAKFLDSLEQELSPIQK